jgi:WD40 repeat protein
MKLSGHEGYVYTIAILPDGRIVSGSEDRTIRIWNSSTGDCEMSLCGHNSYVKAIAVLPDGRIVSGSVDKTIRIWNLSTGECESILYVEGSVEDVRAFPDCRLLSRNGRNHVLWSPIAGGGFQSESLSQDEYYRLKDNAKSDGVVSYMIAPGYAVSHNCVNSESFGRVFVDDSVRWVVKVNDVIAVFQYNGRDHWFREVEVK